MKIVKQMRNLILLASFAPAIVGSAAAAGLPAQLKADPSAVARWQSNRFGMFIHFDPAVLTGKEISWSRAGERRDRDEHPTNGTPASQYDALYHQFYPSNFDARAWVKIAEDAGMKYIVFTAKHHDGFAMFDSRLTDYKITESPFGRDLCAELAKACHQSGFSLGFYYSPPDWHHPDFFQDQARYNQYFHGQVRELLSNYGEVDELWFDTDGGINTPETWDNQDLFPMIRKLQPQILVTTRCGGWGDFATPEQRIGKFQNDEPWETCMTIGTQWSWKPDDKIKSAPEVIRILAECVGGDGNLLLNVGPMPDGRIEPRQVDVLKQVGAWLKKNGESIYGTRGGPWKPTKSIATTRKGNFIYVHVLRNEGNPVELPNMDRDITSATLLNGGQNVKFTKHDGALILEVLSGQRDTGDTVVKLELKDSAMDLPVSELPKKVEASASNSYQDDISDYGPQAAFDDDGQTRWATDEGIRQAWISADFRKPEVFQKVRISEAYAGRVQKFEFQYRDGNDWKTIFTGTTLGVDFQKAFAPVTAQEFRLNILDATQGPTINEIQLEK
jgi:alpha-L-fucosidase